MADVDNNLELAKFRALSKWTPQVGDFIIHHGWLYDKWYGVISNVGVKMVDVIYDGLPFLLFTLLPEKYNSQTKKISLIAIKSSRGGEFAVLQNGVWFVDG